MTSLTVREFFKQFPDDDTCLEHVMKLRFGLTHECQICKKNSTFHKLAKRPAYSCAQCGAHVYPCAGTPFARTRTPLQMWFYAIYLFTTTRHGVPAKELQRQLGVTYKTAWRIGHELRTFMAKVDGDDGLSGHVELDETYVGGKPRNRTSSLKGGKSVAGRPGPSSKKTAVFGLVERGGDLMTLVIPDAKKETLVPIVEQHVAKGTVLSTDQWRAYRVLGRMGYTHNTVDHSRDEWVNGDTHTNTLECFWSHFKTSVRGTHKSVSKKHMQKYLGEFEFRFNLRKDVSGAMFDRLIQAF